MLKLIKLIIQKKTINIYYYVKHVINFVIVIMILNMIHIYFSDGCPNPRLLNGIPNEKYCNKCINRYKNKN